jgi:hypothetical protein
MDAARGSDMSGLLEDLRTALRSLRHARSFSAFVVASLAVGVGASVTLFALVDGVLLRPLPYPRPSSLVAFRSEQSYPDVEDFRTQPGRRTSSRATRRCRSPRPW